MTRADSIRAKSDAPLAFCPIDGLFAAPWAGSATDGGSIRFVDCAVPCPTCGRNVELLPGLYEADGDHLNFLLDPSVSDDALAALRRLLVAIQAGQITPEAAQKEADKVYPGWGRFFDFSKWSPEVRAAVILGAATLIAARISSSPPVTVHNYVQMPPAITHPITPVAPQKHNLLGSTAIPNLFVGHGVHHPPPHHEHKRR